MREDLQWTNLSYVEISRQLAKTSTPVSVTVVKQLLKKHRFGRRKAQRKLALGRAAEQNEQFENIAHFRELYWASENPILSMDTKKKELLGRFYRDGQLLTQDAVSVWDHDFRSVAEGILVPHALYDLKRNVGHLHLGLSRDTSQFACDSVYRWWCCYGHIAYPNATCMLLLCDGGGSNHANHYVFKEDLQKLVNKMGIAIRVAHYPPYCSKYNPIEHRLFPHVTRACQGAILETVEIAKQLMKKTKTRTGLRVTVGVIKKIYQTGRKVAEDFKRAMRIRFDGYLPKWNYVAIPEDLPNLQVI